MLTSLPWLRPLMVAAAVAALAGCASLLGIDEFDNSTTAGGSGGGSGDGGTGGPSEGGGGSNSGTESCLDRVDNNGDGLADCEDPLCQDDHECVPLVTGDWLGIGWLYEDDLMADCPLGQRLELYDSGDLAQPAATCACECDEPTTHCEALASCSSTCGGFQVDGSWATTQCSTLTLNSTGRCEARSLRAVADPCEVAPALTSDGIEWLATAAVCLYAEGGHCAGQESCVPMATATSRGPCVAQMGEPQCPPGYPDRLLYWNGDTDDGRTCSAGGCTCGSATGASCECTGSPCGIRSYYNLTCTGTSQFADMGGGDCLAYLGLSGSPPWNFSMKLEGATVTATGSCPPTGTSQLQGTVTPTTRITVCCVEPSL